MEATFKKKCVRKMIVLLLAIYRGIDIASSQSNYSICNSILVHDSTYNYASYINITYH
jgi:hypothetical protein